MLSCDKDVIMNGINPQTGKRMGKFLWRENHKDRDDYVNELREKIADGYYDSETVLRSIVDELAPVMGDAV